MRKQILALAVVLLVAPVLAQTARAQSADEIVEKHLAAVGGRDALSKLTTRQATGTVSIGVQGMDLNGTIEITTKVPNKSRAYLVIDLSAMGAPEPMTMEQIFDGDTGWTLSPMQGDAQTTGDQLENLKNNVFPSQLMTYKETGATLAVQPAEKVDGRDMIVMLLTPKTGSPIKLYFDATTYLVARTVVSMTSPEMGGTIEQTSTVSDYRAVDGIQIPFRIVNSNPVQSVTIVLDKVVHNVALDDAIFKKK